MQMRGRSYGYSPSCPSPPRGRYGGRSRDLPTNLLVCNLRHDCSVEKTPTNQVIRVLRVEDTID